MQETVKDALSKTYHKLAGWLETLILMLPNLLIATIIFLAFYVGGRVIRKWISKPLSHLSHSQTINDLLLNLVFTAFVAAGIFFALNILQLDKAVTSLLAGAGILGLVLGIAFQDIAANFISGILLAIRKPIQIGHLVESNDYFGKVIRINLRSTILLTQQGQHVHIPNKDIFSKPIKNYSVVGKRRVDLECGVSYGDDLETVKEVALEAISSIPSLDKEQDVTFFYKEFGESSINFTIRYWVKFKQQTDYLAALSEGIIQIKKAFDQHAISIPFPIRTLDFGIKGGENLLQQLQSAGETKDSGTAGNHTMNGNG
jgi:small conductance mechanosensitive channel